MANGNLNVNQAGETGKNVLKLMKNQAVAEFSFKSSRKSITIATNFKTSSKHEEVFIDPNLLFQRLTAIGKNSKASQEHLFEFKLSPFTAPLAKSPTAIAPVFYNYLFSKLDIQEAGEKLLLGLYNRVNIGSLNKLRHKIFMEMVAGKSLVKPE